MDLDGARNAKAEIFARALNFEEVQGVQGLGGTPLFVPSTTSLARGEVITRPNETDGIAVGVATRTEGREYAVAIFVQEPELRNHPIIMRARDIAKGETEIFESGPFHTQSPWNPRRRRPLQPGCSIGHFSITAGTLGAFVSLAGKVGAHVLSNNHVLAAVNAGSLGDELWQPGPADNGTSPQDVAGNLAGFIPIQFGSAAVNYVDCAAGAVKPGTGCNLADVFDPTTGQLVLKLTGATSSTVSRDREYMKCGRTTGLTRGRVLATEVDNLLVNFGEPGNPKLARFDDQIQFYADSGDFSRGGDSGSLIVDRDGTAYALLFAGAPRGAPSGFGITSANPIGSVLSALKATLLVT